MSDYDNTPKSRFELIMRAIIDGTEAPAGEPRSVMEALLLELNDLIKAGGGGGGGTSTIAWKPTVAADGTISWVRTASETKPADQNIKGPKGEDGETGPQGPKGEDGAQGPKGEDGDPGLGIKLVSINQQGHLIITFDDDTTQDAGAIPVGGAVDSVNGQTGVVELDAEDVGALPADTNIPSKTSDLTNDSDFVADASYVHTDNNYDATAKDIVDGVTSALSGKVDKETGKSLIDLTTVVDGASYDSTNHLILFKNGTTTLFSLDAAAFVKDGMVDDVEISGGNLVITFNTDAGKQAISIPLTDIFDPANYYDKTATDNLLADKADDTSVYKTFSFGNTGSGGGTVKYIELTGAYPNNAAKENSYMITGRNGESAILVLPTGMAIGVYNDPRLLYLTRGTSTPIVSVNLDSTNGKVYVGIGSYTYVHISQIGGERTNWSGKIITELPSGATTVAIVSDVANKADKVASATNGNFAGLDANGNLTDSGKKAADFQPVIPEAFTGDLNTLSARGFHQYIAVYADLSNAPTVSYTVNKCYIDVWSDGAGNVCQIIKLVGLTYDPAAKYCDIFKRSCYSTGSALSWGAWEKQNGKADLITSPTNNNLVAMDANGNIKDSSITPSSVASKSATRLTPSDDLNNVTTPGFYYTANSDNPSNIPSGVNVNNNIIEVIKQGEISRCVQLFYSINAQKMWFRIGNSVTNPTTWSSWALIAFGSLATKADKVTSVTSGNLASLDASGNLTDSGVSKDVIPSDASASNKLVPQNSKIRGLKTDNWISTSFNDAVPSDNNSMQIFTVLNSAANTPATGANYIVITQAFDENNIQQEAIQNTTNKRYIRYYDGSSWSSWEKLIIDSDITPSGTRKTIHRNYTNVTSKAVFDTDGVLTKTPTELINALKNKGYVTATSGYEQLHCVINFVNSNTDKVIISDGTHSIDLVNGWIEFEGAFISGTSTFGSEERWVMKLYNVSACEMAIVSKRAGANPIMKSVALT